MKLDQLHYFSIVSETQHIGKAAKILHVSPSAISHSIRKLELDLGHPLFEKSGKNILLTELGKRFATRTKGLLNDAEKLRFDFQSGELPLEGVVRLGATHGISNLILAPFLGEFQKKNPNLIFETYSLRSAQVVEMVTKGELDIGVCFSPNSHPGVVVHHRMDTHLRIAVRKGHPLLQANEAELPKLLSSLPTTGPKAYAGIEVYEDHPALKKAGIYSNIKLISDSYEITAEYIKKNSGWSLMPELLIKPLGLQMLSMNKLKAFGLVALIAPKARAIPPVLLSRLRALF